MSNKTEGTFAIRFWTYLIAARQTVQNGVGESTLALFHAPQPLPDDTIPTILINDLASQYVVPQQISRLLI